MERFTRKEAREGGEGKGRRLEGSTHRIEIEDCTRGIERFQV